MTVQDLAVRLGIGRENATYLMKSDGFPSIRVGRQWVVDENEYQKWYATHHGVTVPTRVVAKPAKRRRKVSLVPNYKPIWDYNEARKEAMKE